MASFTKARTLKEVAAHTVLEPLESNDDRYTDVSAGRAATDLQQLRAHLEDVDASQDRFAQVAFVGHRGSGKSTELLRLEREVSDRFTCLHLYVDESLSKDCDYTDLLLWLVHGVVQRFETDGIRLDDGLVDDVSTWFAQTTLEDFKDVKSEVSTELEAGAHAKVGWYWVGLKLLARIKSRVVGSLEQRKTIRLKLQTYSEDLVARVNLLLDNARTTLEAHRKRPDVLVVQDNLDRLPRDPARRLFYDNADLLKRLRVHAIYTVPIAMVLAPFNINQTFENSFTMPMVKVRNPQGKKFRAGLEALTALVAKRIDLEAVFAGPPVPRHLALMSGGSVRDLIRLVNYAQLAARVKGKQRIDLESAREAVKKLRVDFERLLIPGEVYFPLLAGIHLSKRLVGRPGDARDADELQRDRDFFSQLLFNGSVLEYDGDRSWYDVHPAVQEIEGFKDALREAQDEGPGPTRA